MIYKMDNKFKITNQIFDFTNPEKNSWLIIIKNKKLYIPQHYEYIENNDDYKYNNISNYFDIKYEYDKYGLLFKYNSIAFFKPKNNVLIIHNNLKTIFEYIIVCIMFKLNIYIKSKSSIFTYIIGIENEFNIKIHNYIKNKLYDVIICEKINNLNLPIKNKGLIISEHYNHFYLYLGNIEQKIYFNFNLEDINLKKLILKSNKFKFNTNSVYYQSNYEYKNWNEDKNSILPTLIFKTYDYYYDINKFITYIKKYKNLINPIETILWNFNKKYLLELEKNDIQIIPTFIINDIKDLNKFTDDIVIKPLIGGGSNKVYMFKAPKSKHEFNKIYKILYQSKYSYEKNEYFIVQTYMHGIKDGEISLIFFNTGFYIAYIKKSDKNIINYLDRSVEVYNAENKLIEMANNVLIKSRQKYEYARVDFVKNNNQYYLMELEFIEPNLFFQDDNLQILNTFYKF